MKGSNFAATWMLTAVLIFVLHAPALAHVESGTATGLMSRHLAQLKDFLDAALAP